MDIWQAMETVDKLVMKVSSYPDAQHRHFARFQDQPVTVLEIGVQAGGSLQMWRSYFGDRATIIGADIDPACEAHASEGIQVEIGDQGDPIFLAELVDRWGPFDIVIDDGGHRWDQQILTFETLFPAVKDGGVYVCEDTLTSYLSTYAAGPQTFMDFVKGKVDEMHAWFDEAVEPTDFTRSAVSLHVYLGMVVVEKANVLPPDLISSAGDGIHTASAAALFAAWAETT